VGLSDSRIVRTIDRAQLALTGEALLELFGHFLNGALLEWVGAAPKKKRRGGEESDSEGLQARRILKKVTSDKRGKMTNDE
jgi:hypothetical protein